MTLRITPIQTCDSTVLLRLEGKLAGAAVPELLQVSKDYLDSGRKVSLELSSAHFADAEGVRALRELMDRGVELENISLLLEELLSKSTETVSKD